MLREIVGHFAKQHIPIFNFGLSLFGFGPNIFVLLWPNDVGDTSFFDITPRYLHVGIGRLETCLRWI